MAIPLCYRNHLQLSIIFLSQWTRPFQRIVTHLVAYPGLLRVRRPDCCSAIQGPLFHLLTGCFDALINGTLPRPHFLTALLLGDFRHVQSQVERRFEYTHAIRRGRVGQWSWHQARIAWKQEQKRHQFLFILNYYHVGICVVLTQHKSQTAYNRRCKSNGTAIKITYYIELRLGHRDADEQNAGVPIKGVHLEMSFMT